MKTSALLNDLLRGHWLMDPHQLEGYAPIVHGVISRGNFANVPDTQEKQEEFTLMDVDGSEVTEASEEEAEKIALVKMVGPVMKYGDWCSYGATDIVKMLDRAENDKTVKGTILYVDGPGGAVSAIPPFIDFASRKKKPIVVLSDTACSLHYWTACVVGDFIMGENTVSGRFGSVGVVSSFIDAKKHWEEKGYVFHDIYPTESEDKNLVFKLALEGKYDRIKEEYLSPIAKKFQAAVKEARPNLKTDESGVLSGATFGTDKAVDIGMIDGVGNMQKAIQKVNVLANLYH
ncbi:MAG: hypothetical protein CMM93_08675 [Rickettsiales bacterium]|nr:hypothetical protein [Rickettsiales bacterium]